MTHTLGDESNADETQLMADALNYINNPSVLQEKLKEEY